MPQERFSGNHSEESSIEVLNRARELPELPKDISKVLSYDVRHGQTVEQNRALMDRSQYLSLRKQLQKDLLNYEAEPSEDLLARIQKKLKTAEFKYKNISDTYEHYKEAKIVGENLDEDDEVEVENIFTEDGKAQSETSNLGSENISEPTLVVEDSTEESKEAVAAQLAELENQNASVRGEKQNSGTTITIGNIDGDFNGVVAESVGEGVKNTFAGDSPPIAAPEAAEVEEAEPEKEPPLVLGDEYKIDLDKEKEEALDPSLRYTEDEAAALASSVDMVPTITPSLKNPEAHENFAQVRTARNEFAQAKQTYFSLLKRSHENPSDTVVTERLTVAKEILSITRRARYRAVEEARVRLGKTESLQTEFVKARMVNALARSVAEERSLYAAEAIRNDVQKSKILNIIRSTGGWMNRHKVATGVGLTVLTAGAYAVRKGVVAAAEKVGAGKLALSIMSMAALGGVAGNLTGAAIGSFAGKRKTRLTEAALKRADESFAVDTIDSLEDALLDSSLVSLKNERFTEKVKTAGTIVGAGVGAVIGADLHGAAEEIDSLAAELPDDIEQQADNQTVTTVPQVEAEPKDAAKSTVKPTPNYPPTEINSNPEATGNIPQMFVKEPVMPEVVSTDTNASLGTNPDGFQDRVSNDELSVVSQDKSVGSIPEAERTTPKPELLLTVQSGSSVSETLYQAYCDGKLEHLPEEMSRTEFLNKMYAAIHALDNNEAVMERMSIVSGDLDKIGAGDSFNAAPLLEHMRGASVEEIELDSYNTTDASPSKVDTGETVDESTVRPQARPDMLDTSESVAPTESLRPEARPENLDTTVQNESTDSVRPQIRPDNLDTSPLTEESEPIRPQARPEVAQTFTPKQLSNERYITDVSNTFYGSAEMVPNQLMSQQIEEVSKWVTEQTEPPTQEAVAARLDTIMQRDIALSLLSFPNDYELKAQEYKEMDIDRIENQLQKSFSEVNTRNFDVQFLDNFTQLLSDVPGYEQMTVGEIIEMYLEKHRVVSQNGVFTMIPK